MILSEFLKRLNAGPDFPGLAVIAFQAEAYPAAFFAQMIALLKSKTVVASLDLEQQKLGEIKAQLETSFLGSRMIYWVKNSHDLDAAGKKAWDGYVKTYTGPHCIAYASEKVSSKLTSEHAILVELPEYVDATLYSTLYSAFYPLAPVDQSFVIKIFSISPKVSLDKACQLMAYQPLLGARSEAFFKEWLSKLIAPEKSLFTLSQYLFAKQPKMFLEQWKAIKNDFPDEFWTVYWSEQIWQATLFVTRARSQGIAEAKKAAYRLPFSFINKDWQKYSHESLVQSHQFLTKLDYNLKNSAGTHGLELWFQKFMSKG